MKKITIANGVEITDITLGAGSLGNPKKEEVCFELLDRYVALGGNCMDTGRSYANGEADTMLGKWITSRKHRNNMILCTKGCRPDQLFISRLSPEEITADLESSLKAIGTDYTDLYLLHRDNPMLPVESIMQTLHGLVTAGKIRAIGASNWTVGRINEANQFAKANGLTPFSVSQMHFSLALTTPAQTMDITHVTMNDIEYGWYKETNFPVMSFSPQAKGFFARQAAGLTQKEITRQYYGFLPENYRRAERLIHLAAELGTNVSAVAIAYVRDNAIKTSALTGFSSVAQLEESMDVMNFVLTPDQIRYLEKGEAAL